MQLGRGKGLAGVQEAKGGKLSWIRSKYLMYVYKNVTMKPINYYE